MTLDENRHLVASLTVTHVQENVFCGHGSGWTGPETVSVTTTVQVDLRPAG